MGWSRGAGEVQAASGGEEVNVLVRTATLEMYFGVNPTTRTDPNKIASQAAGSLVADSKKVYDACRGEVV